MTTRRRSKSGLMPAAVGHGDGVAVEAERHGRDQRRADMADAERRGDDHGPQHMGAIEMADGYLVADRGPGLFARDFQAQIIFLGEAEFGGDDQGGAIQQRDDTGVDGRNLRRRLSTRSFQNLVPQTIQHLGLHPSGVTMRFDPPSPGCWRYRRCVFFRSWRSCGGRHKPLPPTCHGSASGCPWLARWSCVH